MKPQRDTKGRPSLDRQRNPRDVDLAREHDVIVVPGPVYGAWDVGNEDAIQTALREFRSGRLHGGHIHMDAVAARPVGAAGSVAPGPGTTIPEPGAAPTGADSNVGALDRHLPRPGSPDDSRRAAQTPVSSQPLTRAQRRARLLTQRALALRADGWDLADIAAELGVAQTTITGWFTTHRRQVTLDEINDTLDQIAVPLATENLIHGLLAGDKDYTIETLKGRGQLRRHGEVEKAPQTALPELRIVFEAGAGGPRDAVATGKVMGTVATPRQIEGAVLESRPLSEAGEGDDDADTRGIGAVSIPKPA